MNFNDFVNLSDLWWWMIVLLNLLGYFLLRYGMTSDARLKVVIEIFGSLLLVSSLVIMPIFFGFLSLIGLILIFWIAATPMVEIIIRKINL